jgi:hypothetical protein
MPYYSATSRAEDAKVLQVAEGQEIKGVDFTVRRLVERTVQVRVTWPNGSPAADAFVCVACEHTHRYESLETAGSYTKTDQNGVGVVHLYGNSRVRLYAEQIVYRTERRERYYSHRVESEIGKMPEKVNLVLTSPKP